MEWIAALTNSWPSDGQALVVNSEGDIAVIGPHNWSTPVDDTVEGTRLVECKSFNRIVPSGAQMRPRSPSGITISAVRSSFSTPLPERNSAALRTADGLAVPRPMAAPFMAHGLAARCRPSMLPRGG